MWVHLLMHVRRYVSVPRVGQIEKIVRCERCNCQYGYVVHRRAIGRSGYSIWRSKKKAADSATYKVAVKVVNLLANAIEPVPCPSCGWVQGAMVREMRRRFGRWIIAVGAVALVIFLCTAGVIYLNEINDPRRPIRATSLTRIEDAFVLAIALYCGAIASRYALSFLVDPNSVYRADRPSIPGSPIGYRIGDSATIGKSALSPMPDERPGRATVQLAVARFPAQCCRCLKETSTTRRFRCGKLAQITVPVCQSCIRWVKAARVLLGIGGGLLGFVAGCAGAIYLPQGESEIALPVAVGGAAFGAALGLLIARSFRVVKFSRFSSDRNVVRIDFKNHQYADLMREEGRLV